MSGLTHNPFPYTVTTAQACAFSHAVIDFKPAANSPEEACISIGYNHRPSLVRATAQPATVLDRLTLYNPPDITEIVWESRFERATLTPSDDAGNFKFAYTAFGDNTSNTSYYTRLVGVIPEVDPATAIHWLIVRAINADISDTHARKRRKRLAWHTIGIGRSPDEIMQRFHRFDLPVHAALAALPEATRNKGLAAHNERLWKEKSA